MIFKATRYHSLIIERETMPKCLKITAETEQKEIMAIEHKQYLLFGAQFHPESILSESGKTLLRNFMHIARSWPQAG
jgi:anthranilate/para-aminobenzoate synthase component II